MGQVSSCAGEVSNRPTVHYSNLPLSTPLNSKLFSTTPPCLYRCLKTIIRTLGRSLTIGNSSYNPLLQLNPRILLYTSRFSKLSKSPRPSFPKVTSPSGMSFQRLIRTPWAKSKPFYSILSISFYFSHLRMRFPWSLCRIVSHIRKCLHFDVPWSLQIDMTMIHHSNP